MNWFIFAISTLATYRLSVMFSKERGPAGIFQKIREWPDPDKNQVLYDGLRCLWCVSVWMATLITLWLFYLQAVNLWWAPVYILGLSGGAILLSPINKL